MGVQWQRKGTTGDTNKKLPRCGSYLHTTDLHTPEVFFTKSICTPLKIGMNKYAMGVVGNKCEELSWKFKYSTISR